MLYFLIFVLFFILFLLFLKFFVAKQVVPLLLFSQRVKIAIYDAKMKLLKKPCAMTVFFKFEDAHSLILLQALKTIKVKYPTKIDIDFRLIHSFDKNAVVEQDKLMRYHLQDVKQLVELYEGILSFPRMANELPDAQVVAKANSIILSLDPSFQFEASLSLSEHIWKNKSVESWLESNSE